MIFFCLYRIPHNLIKNLIKWLFTQFFKQFFQTSGHNIRLVLRLCFLGKLTNHFWKVKSNPAHAISHTHASTCSTNLMCVKNTTHHFKDFPKHFLGSLCCGKNSIFNWVFKLDPWKDFFYENRIVWKINYAMSKFCFLVYSF